MISLLSKRLSRVVSRTTVRKHQVFSSTTPRKHIIGSQYIVTMISSSQSLPSLFLSSNPCPQGAHSLVRETDMEDNAWGQIMTEACPSTSAGLGVSELRVGTPGHVGEAAKCILPLGLQLAGYHSWQTQQAWRSRPPPKLQYTMAPFWVHKLSPF